MTLGLITATGRSVYFDVSPLLWLTWANYIYIFAYMNTLMLADHAVFKALGDPTRLRIVVLLLDRELCVCDLSATLELPQPSISRHMAVLRSAGLVQVRRDGRWLHYRLSDSPLLGYIRGYLADLQMQKPHADDLNELSQHLKVKKC